MSQEQNRIASDTVSGDRPMEYQSERLTQVSGYDKVSAFLASAIVLLGLMLVIGFLAWMNQFDWEGRTDLSDIDFGIYDHVELTDALLEIPIDEPDESLFSESDKNDLPQALQAMTTAVSNNAGTIDAYYGQHQIVAEGRSGVGDGFSRGKPKPETIPEPQRWRIKYQATTRNDYHRQLDHFGIELGVISTNSPRIDLVSKLSAERPELHETSRKEENRLYFTHVNRRLRNWDFLAMKDAGMSDNRSDRIVVQLYNDEVRELLRAAESAFLKESTRKLEEVGKTIFEVRENSGEFEFYVNRIEYRLLDGQN